MKLIATILLVVLMACRVGAAPDATQFQKQPAPAGVLLQMKKDGQSVLFQQVDAGPKQGELFCHIYTVDKNYFLNVFRLDGTGAFQSLNLISLGDTPHSAQLDISFMWLQPKHQHGPILRLFDQDFPGEWDQSDELLVFRDGFEGRVVQQGEYLTKIIGGTAINPSFDSYDERGLLIVHLWEVYETQLQSHVLLHWNGQGFAERKPPSYLIISPLFKTYAAAKDYLKSPKLRASDQIIAKPPLQPTRYYQEKGLMPGRVVAILRYLESPAEAQEVSALLHKQGVACSVLRFY